MRHFGLVVAMVLVADPALAADAIDNILYGGDRTDHALLGCAGVGGSESSTGTTSMDATLGYGYEYAFEETENYLYGFREQIFGCLGVSAGFSGNGDLETTEVFEGNFLSGGYHPWGLAILPQGTVTFLALVGVPAFYLNAGFSGLIQAGEMVTFTGDDDPVEESREAVFRLQAGPSAVLGMQVRLLALRVFVERHLNFTVGVPESLGLSGTVLVGLGVFW